MSSSFVTPWTVACRLLRLWDFPGKNTGEGCHVLPGNLPDSGIELESPALAGRYFTTEPPGKPVRNGWASENFGNVNKL